VLRGSAAGYQDATVHVQVQGGERSELSLVLAPEVASAPVSSGAAAAPAVPATSAAQIPTPAAVAASAPAPEAGERGFKGHGLRYTWLAVGVGAAFGGAAVAFWYAGQNKLDDLSAKCAHGADGGHPCERGKTDTGSIKRYERLTNASIGLAAASAVAAVVLMSFEWPRERDRNLALNLGPQTVTLRGSF
jgi:hypothetical protein